MTVLTGLFVQTKKHDLNQAPLHQAVEGVFQSPDPFLAKNPKYIQQGLLERVVEPERVIILRASRVDDKDRVQVNCGYRVQMSSATGPYRGGLRFHPTIDLGVLKFLALEQVFKNALTTLPMSDGKGGSDFDPKGKSDGEVMRFCQTLVNELYRHIGADTDVPAGDTGVGGREIGLLYGQYKKVRNEFASVLTSKGLAWGGSLIRPGVTGYGTVYFVESMLQTHGDKFAGERVVISGSDSVAQHTCGKAVQPGAKILTVSDSNGFVLFPDNGMIEARLEVLTELKEVRRERVAIYARGRGLQYFENQKLWGIKCDIVLPCTTQNELDEQDVKTLLANGCFVVVEGASMPSMPGAVKQFAKADILYAPGKTPNAGGVATSGLEMSQNAIRLPWVREEIDQRLLSIMQSIHKSYLTYGKEGDEVNYVSGANIAGFVKAADVMLAQSIV